MQIMRYLQYMIDNKRLFKLDEDEVLELLSEGLKLELIMHLNGKMLHNTIIFKNFDLLFLSDLTFMLKRETFTVDELIFNEDDPGEFMYFLTKGNIILLHKKSCTFIKELVTDQFLGEVAFFSDQPRKATARSKNFTEVLTLSKADFLECTLKYEGAQQVHNYI